MDVSFTMSVTCRTIQITFQAILVTAIETGVILLVDILPDLKGGAFSSILRNRCF